MRREKGSYNKEKANSSGGKRALIKKKKGVHVKIKGVVIRVKKRHSSEMKRHLSGGEGVLITKERGTYKSIKGTFSDMNRGNYQM